MKSLFAFVATSAFVSLAWADLAFAQSQVQRPAAQNVSRVTIEQTDPIGGAARALWERMQLSWRENCGGSRRAASPRLAIRPFDANNSTITDGQRSQLRQQLASNLGSMRGASLRDYDEMLRGRNVSINDMLSQDVDYLVIPSIVRIDTGFRLELAARHASPECQIMSAPVQLGQNDVVEPLHSRDTMFEAVTRQLVESEGGADVLVGVRQPHLANQPMSDDEWASMTTTMQTMLRQARENSSLITTRQNTDRAFRATSETVRAADGSWIAEVRMTQTRNRLRAEIEVTRQADGPTGSRVADVVAVDPNDFITRQIAQNERQNTPSQSGQAASIPLLQLTPRAALYRDELGLNDQRRSFAIRVNTASYVEIEALSNAGLDFSISIISENGSAITPEPMVASRPNRHRFEIPRAGMYVVNVQPNRERQVLTYQLRVRGAPVTLDAEPPFRVTQIVGDWVVGESFDQSSGARRCHAATSAIDMAPRSGWRFIGPFIEFRTQDERSARGGQIRRDAERALTLTHAFDFARFFGRTPNATITMAGGEARRIHLSQDGPILASVAPCAGGQGGMCFVEDTIRLLTRGSELNLRGVTRDGQPASVSYSLRGYTAAMNAISALCGNPNIADRLIWR
jgi:hypothetical protein